MALPTDPKAPWPPKMWADCQHDIDEAAAWYSGDAAKLATFYGAPGSTEPQAGRLAKFWARRQLDRNTARQRLHVPAAADVAATSADLLFGEIPSLTIAEAHKENATADAKGAEDRLQELVELDGITQTLLEGAEVCGALGGVFLRPVWDPTVADRPMLTVVHADAAVPEFRYGQLTAVTFWRVVLTDKDGMVWRHLERHEPGVVLHGLYAGDKDRLGVKMQLADNPETANLAVDTDGGIALPSAIEGLLVRYVPNVLPNRKHRGMAVGRSDTAGTEPLMDALDETWTSWMRDIRLAKARIIVPNEYLEHRGRGLGAGFDMDAEVFSPLEMDPAKQEKAGITLNQFEIRTDAHSNTSLALMERIVATAGYSPQTFGLKGDGNRVQTATEVRAREGRSLRTTSRKQRYWARAVEDTALNLLIIDKEIFGSQIVPVRPRLDFEDGTPDDPMVTAQTVQLLDQARAVSVETKVRMAQPELEEAEVKAEVARILDEQGLSVPDPTGNLDPTKGAAA